jgi:hypothetical protein
MAHLPIATTTPAKTAAVTALSGKQQDAVIAAELLRLQVAYPAQSRKFAPEEIRATNALWKEIFAGVDPRVFHEAVTRFIRDDRKAFFPSPGQISGFVEKILQEIKDEEHWAELEGYRA